MSIIFLNPVVKDYQWGNDRFIPSIIGTGVSGPQAELWMGAHKSGSSIISEGQKGAGMGLYDYLDENPVEFGFKGADFPFLFKTLAIAQPLSIQCHPNAEQAAAGYDSEQKLHGKTDRSLWNYQDANPKAEMLYALTEVTAMCGFRPMDGIIERFRSVCGEFYDGYLSDASAIGDFFDRLYRLPHNVLLEAQKSLVEVCTSLSDSSSASACGSCISFVEKELILKLYDKYPGDPGVFAPLFLNVIVLQPGQAVYLKPGVLHAYVFGNGMELMNNSDNVLRAGLTSKHMDVTELEKVMTKEPYAPSPMESFTDECGKWFPCEGGFSLCVMDHGVFNVPGGKQQGACMFLCTEGQGYITVENGPEAGMIRKFKKGSIFLCDKEYAHCVHSEDSVLYMATEGVWNCR